MPVCVQPQLVCEIGVTCNVYIQFSFMLCVLWGIQRRACVAYSMQSVILASTTPTHCVYVCVCVLMSTLEAHTEFANLAHALLKIANYECICAVSFQKPQFAYISAVDFVSTV
jgi:hypothetical protein